MNSGNYDDLIDAPVSNEHDDLVYKDLVDPEAKPEKAELWEIIRECIAEQEKKS